MIVGVSTPTDVRTALKKRDPCPRLRQRDCRGQPSDSPADDDNVPMVRHHRDTIRLRAAMPAPCASIQSFCAVGTLIRSEKTSYFFALMRSRSP